MIDCYDLLENVHRHVHDQIDLAMIAEAEPVAAMHIDLALFGAEQARLAEWLCE